VEKYMKKTNGKKTNVIGALFAIIMLSACGAANQNSNGSGAPNGNVGGVNNSIYNGGAGGCVPLQAGIQIPFTMNGAQTNSVRIFAGLIPQSAPEMNPGQHGQMIIGSNGQMSGGQGTIGLTGANAYGVQIQINAQQTSQSTLNGSGVIMIGQAQIQAWQYRAASSGLNPNSLCVSGIALDLAVQTTRLYGGRVYVYLNNSATGFYAEFL
jgi:hypothetical protein